MSATYLFDASSVVDLVLGNGGERIDISVAFDESLLDLTMYEAANAVWKIGVAHDDLSDEDLDAAVGVLEGLHREVSIVSVAGDVEGTMRVARDDGLTFYDAAYLATAEWDGLTLVTEDGALRDAALDRDVAVETVSNL